MRKSLGIPLVIGALLILLMVGAQVGLRHHDLVALIALLGYRGTPFVWTFLGVAALAVWGFTRDRGIGFYALGTVPYAMSLVISLLGWVPLRFFVYPLLPLGLALASLAWSGHAAERSRRALLILAATTAAIQYLHLLTINLHGGTMQMAGILQLVQASYWALLTAVAWNSYRQTAVRPLFWLSLQTLCLTLHVALGGLSLLWHQAFAFIPTLFYEALTILSFVAVAGVIWSAARRPNSGR